MFLIINSSFYCEILSRFFFTDLDGIESLDCGVVFDRRQVLLSSVGFLTASISNAGMAAAEFADSNIYPYLHFNFILPRFIIRGGGIIT